MSVPCFLIDATERTYGYHATQIPKGKLGESSKILEELLELQDAEQQGAKIMALVELSDILGAVEHYLVKHFPGMTMKDLEKMSYLTQRAFRSEQRVNKDVP